MRRFVRSFVRESSGVWVCVKSAEVQLPQGRIQVTPGTRFTRGSMFMGVEITKLLEEQYEQDKRI